MRPVLVRALLACAAIALLAAAPASAELKVLGSFGSAGAGPGQFNNPIGIHYSPAGEVFVADGLNDRVQAFTPAGAYLRTYGSSGTGRGQFRLPEDAEVIGPYLFVTDCYNSKVHRLRLSDGMPAGDWSGFNCPEGMAALSGDRLAVADTFNNRIVVLDALAGGAVLQTFGSQAQPLVRKPRDISVNPVTGEWIVPYIDSDQCKGSHIARINPADGKILGLIGDGILRCPSGADVDAVGNIYVVDWGQPIAFTPSGAFAGALPGPPGRGWIFAAYLDTDPNCNVYVVERDAPAVTTVGQATGPSCQALTTAPPKPVTKPKDSVKPVVTLTAPKRVNPLLRASIPLTVSCPLESCRFRAFGTVRIAGATRYLGASSQRLIAAGDKLVLKLAFAPGNRTFLQRARRLVRTGHTLTVKVTVVAKDTAFNQARTRMTVRLGAGG